MNSTATRRQPPSWALLEQALTNRQPIRLHYHGHERVVCPHALGWKNGRAKVLAYQTAGTTSNGQLPDDPRQRWRSLYIDEIDTPQPTDGAWQTGPNATTTSNCIDEIAVTVDMTANPND